MRFSRPAAILLCTALLAAGALAWRLRPPDARTDPIVVGTTGTVTSLDPAGAYDTGSWALFENVYQKLLTLAPGSTVPTPDAAESCRFTGAGLRTYTCRLRRDLVFPDGRPVTGADVKFSVDRVRAIASPVGPASVFDTLRAVEAGEAEVTFRLTTADATFPLKLATGAAAIVDRRHYPARTLRTGHQATGTGPYLIRDHQPGRRILLAPNDRYRGAVPRRGAPVEIRYFDDPAELAAAWERRRVDVVNRALPPKLLTEVLGGSPDVRVDEAGSGESRMLVFNLRRGSPAADVAVRRAVAALVDRPRLAAGPYLSTVDPLLSVVPRGYAGHVNAFQDEYPRPSRERAARILSEAGLAPPVKLTYGHRSGPTLAREAAELRRQLEAGGLFRVTVLSADWPDFQRNLHAGRYDVYGFGWVPDFPDPDNFAQPLVGTRNALGNRFSSRRVDALLTATRRHEQRTDAEAGFRALQREVAREVPVLPLWQRKEYVLSSPDVTGAQYLVDGGGSWRLWELRWA
ncbi:peptide-binding protein [Streptomyces solincola]|uniref:Peptide-binding protein n=1 Tax=Streptomyces solincola TaxID=2100817 RepID=A0A2S9Q0L3_9ACTN|nr:ABC transporter substrate-binding protein [Streptomyces solincola]PRH80211.1 peptide-binding protein [Streptomyces solincola]